MIKNYEPLFRSILNGIKSQVNHEKSMETVFFDIMKENAEIFRKLGFIRYINIFNNLGADKIGHIEFYADFIHTTNKSNKIATGKKLITNKRDEIDIGNHLFDDNIKTIGQLLRDNREFGKSYEYVRNGAKRIEDNWRYSTIQHYNWHNDLYTYDHIGIGSFFKDKDTKKQFKNWLEYLNNCYDPENNGVTNFIFIIGPTYYGKDKNLEDELEKYTISANIGIDARKSKAASIVYFIEEFRSFIEQLSFNLTTDINDYQKRQTAVKSSLAQVMARNMSHNISSHVLSNLIDDKTYEKLRDEAVLEIIKKLKDEKTPNITNGYCSSIKVRVENKNLQLPYFFQYLKSRMDYLSEVTFSLSNIVTTKMMFGDVLKEFDRVRILLNHISGITGFRYRIDAFYNGVSLASNDIGVSFVGHELGCHAFYIICENIIRNTAKHSIKHGDTVVFSINIHDVKNHANVAGADEYYCIEIDNGIKESNIDQLVEAQNKRLNQSVLDQNNQLRNNSLGLLEMEAAAAYLRQIDMPNIESDDYYIDNNTDYYHERNGIKRLNIIKAFKTANDTLGYRFFLKRPSEILFVGDWFIDSNATEDKKYKTSLLYTGIHFINSQSFVKAINNGIAFPHQFIVYNSDINKDAKELLMDKKYSSLLPLRKLELSQSDSKEIFKDSPTLTVLYDFIWKRYLKNISIDDLLINVEPDYTTDKKYQITFLDHGDAHRLKTHFSPRYRDYLKNHTMILENLSSQTMSKLPRFTELAGVNNDVQLYKSKLDNTIKYQLYEAYCKTKLIVIDERIQKYAVKSHEGKGVSCYDLFKSTNIIMPDETTPLDPEIFSDNHKQIIIDIIDKNISDSFLLIHYGILERIFKNDYDEINRRLNNWAELSCRVVVTSGRGSHSLNLPQSVCFMNLSSVLYSLVENRNKYLINTILHQARRKSNEQ